MTTFEPAYRQLARTGELRRRVEQAYEHLFACDLCAWNCRVDRRARHGVCQTGMLAIVSSYGPHHGEENPLRGWLGSGTIFFAWCNLKNQYAQPQKRYYHFRTSCLAEAVTNKRPWPMKSLSASESCNEQRHDTRRRREQKQLCTVR